MDLENLFNGLRGRPARRACTDCSLARLREYIPPARRRAKRVGKVSELPAVGAIGEDAALLYDVVATAELDAARTPPSTDAEECDDDDAALLMALKAAPCAS